MTNIVLIRWICKWVAAIQTIIGIGAFMYVFSIVIPFFVENIPRPFSTILTVLESIGVLVAIVLSIILSISTREIKKFLDARYSPPTQEEFDEMLEMADKMEENDCY